MVREVSSSLPPNSFIARPAQNPAGNAQAAVYRVLDESDELTPLQRAINGTRNRAKNDVPAFVPGSHPAAPAPLPRQLPQAPVLNAPAAPPAAPSVSQAVSAAAVAAATAAANIVQTVEDWRQALPQTAAATQVIDLASAVERCDRIICGQPNIKRRLALSFGAGAYTSQRFYYFLQGPAGVGKTTLASALGSIYGRPVAIIRCDRLSSVEELFGYGPNWKSPGPGRITRAIVASGHTNPILFFDEIDKISGEKKDAILGALNELLSRETTKYRDNFLECDIDISDMSFLCAANSDDVFQRIPWLKSRMGQVLPLAGYNTEELRQIFTDYLLPDVNKRQWSPAASAQMKLPLSFTEDARDLIIRRYRTAMGADCGVRELKDWLADFYSGFLQLGTPGTPVTVSWLEDNWDVLLPGHPSVQPPAPVAEAQP